MIKRLVKLPEKHSFFLFGSRQTGKSTLIHAHIKNKKCWQVNLLENEVYLKYLTHPEDFRREAVVKIEKERITVIFIDEVQRLPLLLNEVQALMFHYKKCQFILTGSSARKLKRGAANLLGGRAIQYFLFPFTQQELGDKFHLNEVLVYGSLPFLLDEPKEIRKELLRTYGNTYLKEEIQAEGIVRNLAGFSRFLEIASSQNGESVNFSAIARDAMLPAKTTQSYYEILEDTLIAIALHGWRKSVRKQLSGHPKFYFFDTGVCNALCNRLSDVPDPATRGRMFEHWVIIETYRLLIYYFPDIRMYYWRTNTGMEVDLIFVKAQKIVAACEIKSTKRVSRTDLSGLRSFLDDNPAVPCYVIADVPNSFTLDQVEVLTWKSFFDKLISSSLFN